MNKKGDDKFVKSLIVYFSCFGRDEDTLKEVSESSDKISNVVGDMTDSKAVQEVIDTVKNKFGRIDILVNNVGWCSV